MMAQFAREYEIGVAGLEDGMAATGADADGTDGDVFDLAGLRDGDGEALGVADAAGNALDEVGQGLGVGEGDEAAYAGGFEASGRVGGGVDYGASVRGGGSTVFVRYFVVASAREPGERRTGSDLALFSRALKVLWDMLVWSRIAVMPCLVVADASASALDGLASFLHLRFVFLL